MLRPLVWYYIVGYKSCQQSWQVGGRRMPEVNYHRSNCSQPGSSPSSGILAISYRFTGLSG